MNSVDIVEGGHYKVPIGGLGYTKNLYIIKLVKMRVSKRFDSSIIDCIVYSDYKDLSFEETMSLEQFKEIVLYKVESI